jgi:uncharacterized protein
MQCPRCESSVLDEREREGVTVDVCRQCRGLWLDRSELERIVARAVREQAEYEQPAPPQPAAYPMPQPGYPPQPGYSQQRYRDDDTPPRGFRRDEHAHDRRYRKKHWFESLSDIFD